MRAALRAVIRTITRRPWITATVAVIAAGAAVGGYLLSDGSSGGAAAAAPTTNRLVSVASGTVAASVSATGTFAPADERNVSFSSTALITSVAVTQGQQVAKGQRLGTVATVTLKAALAQAKATLASTNSTLATAQDDDDTTDAQLAADQASVASAQSAVTSAEQNLDGATLVSPIAGTVAEVNVSVGQQSSGNGSSGSTSESASGSSSTGSAAGRSTGAAGSSGSGGETSSSGTSSAGSASTSNSSGDFVIVGMKAWTVSVSVDDTEVGLLAKGDQARMTTDNVSGTVFGTVSSISVLSSSSSGAAEYPVDITVTGSPTGLHDGASATVAIVYKQVTGLTVPTLAVHRSGSTSFVYVSASGAKTKRTVRLGLSSAGTSQVVSGLASGQQVYVETVNRAAGSGASGRAGAGRTGAPGRGSYPGGGNFPGGGGNFPGGGGYGGGNR